MSDGASLVDVAADVATDIAGGDTAPMESARRGFSAALDADAPEPSPARSEPAPGSARNIDDGALREAAERMARDRYGDVADAFGQLDPEMAGALTRLARLYAADPERAALELAREFGFDVGEFDDGELMTLDDLRAEMRAEFEAQAQEMAAQAELVERVETARGSIQSTAADLGFPPDSDRYQGLLRVAAERFGHLRSPIDAIKAAAEALNAPAPKSSKAPKDGEPKSMQDSLRQFRSALDEMG